MLLSRSVYVAKFEFFKWRKSTMHNIQQYHFQTAPFLSHSKILLLVFQHRESIFH